MNILLSLVHWIPVFVVLFAIALIVLKSSYMIGPAEIGLVTKKFGKKLPGENVIAFNGEAGYQAELLKPGWRVKFWPIYSVKRYPQVQIPAGKIGVVLAQVGDIPPQGAKSGIYKKEFKQFTDVAAFVNNGGQKGVQRPVLPPGVSLPIHPIAFLVVTEGAVFGQPITDKMAEQVRSKEPIAGVTPEMFRVTEIKPQGGRDVIGVVRTLEGKPLTSGSMASRLGGFADIEQLEKEEVDGKQDDAKLIEALLSDKNNLHNNYQDFQAFLDAGGEMGLQHDVLRYGAYNLNPALVRVELADMLVVNQGQTAVVKAYVGLATEDQSGDGFKFGALVRPGHRGLWQTPLRTGKYAINPRIYANEMVPTAILNLNWAKASSEAHDLDKNLNPIVAKSCEGFVFTLDLQVQMHVPDTKAPKVISAVGSMRNLVEEVLQAAVGNHFRDKLQTLPAVEFIQQRQKLQQAAFDHISKQLDSYDVETRGVYIQDVILPEQLVTVLTEREIANQQVETLKKKQEAEMQRVETEKAKGTADQQAELAKSKVGIEIEKNKAAAKVEEGRGQAEFLKLTGEAAGAKIRAEGLATAESIEAQGLATAKGMAAQQEALGKENVMVVNAIKELVKAQPGLFPKVLAVGGGVEGNGGVGTTLMGLLTALTDKAEATK